MRDETKARLNRAIWRDRLQGLGFAVALASLPAAGLAYQSLDTNITDVAISGKLTEIDALAMKGPHGGTAVTVKLNDGRELHLISHQQSEPHVGDQVSVIEHRHASGRVTHTF